MQVDHEPEARRVLYRWLLQIPDGVLLLITAGSALVGVGLAMMLLGQPGPWWKDVIFALAGSGPALLGLRLSQEKRQLEAERRAPGSSGSSSTPPGSGA
ncbi:MAG: hypothetical protein ACF8LK_04720 [Phycisphaerales bacterium JB041]